jgi:clan AA aspartic protease
MTFIRKDIEAGRQINMRFGPKGETFITLEITNEEKNLLEKAEFLIDTGFNGYIQLEKSLVDKLGIEITGKSKTKGFDGIEKEVGIIKTKIKLLNQEICNFPIQVVENGRFLIGTNLLKDLGKMIIIDYRNNIFTMTDEKKVQKKVHKAVEKYQK